MKALLQRSLSEGMDYATYYELMQDLVEKVVAYLLLISASFSFLS